MYRKLLLIIVVMACCYGCRRLPDIQGPGETMLQGYWKQDTLAGAAQLLNYTKYDVKISCDSFYMTMNVFAKVNYQNSDSCFNKDGWKEYTKGVYRVSNDTLILSGDYTKPNFKQKISGCFNTGNYLQKFLLKKVEKGSLLLNNLGNNQNFELLLKESIVCKQKPL